MRKLFSTGVSDSAFAFAMLLLRLGAGSLMLMQHGLDKLMHFQARAAHFSDPFGIGSTTSLAMVLFAEVFCATFVIMGLFTRLACIPLVIAMSVALIYANHSDFYGKGELPGLYLVCFLVILFNGPGKVSLDNFIAK
jgi:putative oxidoreductase